MVENLPFSRPQLVIKKRDPQSGKDLEKMIKKNVSDKKK